MAIYRQGDRSLQPKVSRSRNLNNMGDNTDPRNILKTNIIFGGVKIFQMLVGLIRNKIVALFLGPAGIGIQTLLMTTINTIIQITNLGVPQSGVRELAIQKNQEGKSKVILSINYLSILLGALSVVLCLIFSRSLSLWVFKSPDYQFCFIIVSFAILFESIMAGEVAILQGFRDTKRLAISSLMGAIISLLVSVPLYYYWRIDAIPYALVIGSVISCGSYFFFRYNKIRPQRTYKYSELKNPIESILKLGITLMVSNSFMSILVMALNLVIRRCGTLEDVGFYQAAYSCTYSFISILIAVLASDYYPRLSEKIDNKTETLSIINTQMSLFFYILMPIVALIVCFPHTIVNVLYTSTFGVIAFPVQIMGIALIFRVLWQIFSYVILAKGDRRAFLLIDAFLGNGMFFGGNIVGFLLFGLKGLSISYLVMSLFVMLLLLLYVKKQYKIEIPKTIVLYSLAFSIVSLLVVWLSQQYNSMFILLVRIVYFIFSIIICLVLLQKELDIINGIKTVYKRLVCNK